MLGRLDITGAIPLMVSYESSASSQASLFVNRPPFDIPDKKTLLASPLKLSLKWKITDLI